MRCYCPSDTYCICCGPGSLLLAVCSLPKSGPVKGWFLWQRLTFLGSPYSQPHRAALSKCAPNFWAFPDHEHKRSPEISNSCDLLLVRPCRAPPAKHRTATLPSLPNWVKPQTTPVRAWARPKPGPRLLPLHLIPTKRYRKFLQRLCFPGQFRCQKPSLPATHWNALGLGRHAPCWPRGCSAPACLEVQSKNVLIMHALQGK